MTAPTATLGDAADALDQLPRLAPSDLIPEINGLMIDSDGNLRPRLRKEQFIVTFKYKSRRITARLSGQRDEPIALELGCRLVRLPYSCESKGSRKHLLDQIYLAKSRYHADLTVTHHQWLYCREKLTIKPSILTASWLVTQLTLAALCMQPIIELFNANNEGGTEA